jgi:hypothetical protein
MSESTSNFASCYQYIGILLEHATFLWVIENPYKKVLDIIGHYVYYLNNKFVVWR